MKPHLHSNPCRRSSSNAGFTLVEMMIAIGIGLVVMGVVATVTVSTAFNYTSMSNYTSMDDEGRNALDTISREIRDSSTLISFSTNSPQYLLLTNNTSGVTVTITYTNNTLVLAKTGQTSMTLLTGCDSWNFTLCNGSPLITSNAISFYASTNFTTGQLDPTFTKVINMTWKCSRTILGTKLNTESVQTAQVILRNKVNW